MPFIRPVCGARSGLSAGLYCGDRPPAAITAMEKVWRVLHAQVGQPMGRPHAPAENLPSPISNRAYVTYRQLSRLEGPRDGQTEGRTTLESEATCQGWQQQPKAGHGKENRRLTEDCAQSRQEVGKEDQGQRSQNLQGRGSTSEPSRANTRGCQEKEHDCSKERSGQSQGEGEG
jgi:hypothetical protein